MINPFHGEILSIREEGRDMATLTIEFPERCRPGNFVMIWIPFPEEYADEIPMSVSGMKDGAITITVKGVGPTTRMLLQMKPGIKIGISGPFGNGFSGIGERPLVVGGGVGLASLMPLIREFVALGKNISVVAGGKSWEDIPFRGELSRIGATFTTEDGSAGIKGTVLNGLPSLAEHDIMYACGPHTMLKALWRRGRDMKIDVEMSMEAMMRCGRGLCGSCSMAGYLVCRDGPVFNREMLEEIWRE